MSDLELLPEGRVDSSSSSAGDASVSRPGTNYRWRDFVGPLFYGEHDRLSDGFGRCYCGAYSLPLCPQEGEILATQAICGAVADV